MKPQPFSIYCEKFRLSCSFEKGDGGCRHSLLGAVIPKKTRIARFSRIMSASAKRPMDVPIFVFGTVVSLSTIKRQTARSPLLSLGLIGSRKRGASVGSVVNA